MELLKRPTYTDWLKAHKDKQVIKIISGLRRVGKSTILRLYADELKKMGVGEDHILTINLEEKENAELLDEDALYRYVMSKVPRKGTLYVMLDEVQQVKNFERAVDSLYVKENIDVYITGSNAKFLSSEMSTILTGRYVEINVLPLSFREYYGFYGAGEGSRKELFNDYATYGAMPGTLMYDKGTSAQREYLESVFRTILEKDVLKRNAAAGRATVENITSYLLYNIGCLTSTKRITDTLNTNGIRVSYNTVDSYFETLQDCFFVYKAPRYDVAGKGYLQNNNKYYITDIGFNYYLLNNRSPEISQILENLVYLELKRRRYKVATCKVDDKEVDFMAVGDDGTPRYVQVAVTVAYQEKLEQELRPFYSVPDNYPKYLITLDDYFVKNHDGIVTVNAIDFLYGQEL